MLAGYYKKVDKRLEKLKESASENKTACPSTAYSLFFSMLLSPNRKVGCEADVFLRNSRPLLSNIKTIIFLLI